MTRMRFISVFLLTIVMALPTAVAQDGTQDRGQDGAPEKEQAEEAKPKGRIAKRAEKRRQRIMEEYQATGKTRSCVPMRSLRQSIILDDQTIFFESIGRKGYMNKLSHACRGLVREERFAYSNSFGSLCRAEIITILDSFGRSWGSCGLGDFEEYEKKPKADSDK